MAVQKHTLQISFPKAASVACPSWGVLHKRGIKAGFLLPWAVPKCLSESDLPEQHHDLFCPSPEHQAGTPWGVISPGTSSPQAGIQRLPRTGFREEVPGSHILLHTSHWQQCHLELASGAKGRAQLRTGAWLLLGKGCQRGGTGTTQQSCNKCLFGTLLFSLS